MIFPPPIQNLINQFSRLPGIGPKTSERLVFSLLRGPKNQIQNLTNALSNFSKEIHLCGRCFNFASGLLCKICSDPKRDHTTICVVADNLDLLAIESSGYQGLYHVLGGLVNPLSGIKLENLRIRELIKRIGKVKEVILAFDPNQEGELTCHYLKQALLKLNQSRLAPNGAGVALRITRLGLGLPQGGDLDYADEVTLREALKGRR
jgi:recombination protein RecR